VVLDRFSDEGIPSGALSSMLSQIFVRTFTLVLQY
jgi:hypothetical protein